MQERVLVPTAGAHRGLGPIGPRVAVVRSGAVAEVDP
jgi:hypothetical protein